MTQPLSRPEALPGQTYRVHWPDSEHALYITLNDIVQDGRRRPFEIFINSKNMEHYAWTVALTRMISAVFRRGGDVAFVVEEMKAVFDPRGGAWMDGRYVPSLLAAIGDVIERHMIAIGFLPPKGAAGERAIEARVVNLDPGARRRTGVAAFRRRSARTIPLAAAAMSEMRRGGADPHRGLRPVHELRLFQMRLAGLRLNGCALQHKMSHYLTNCLHVFLLRSQHYRRSISARFRNVGSRRKELCNVARKRMQGRACSIRPSRAASLPRAPWRCRPTSTRAATFSVAGSCR